MIEEGERAPEFCLPAVVDEERREVGLADHLEESVVVLAFYPGDFNPACDEMSTGLDELDLLTMGKDVTVLGVSGDSVHSHRTFAAEYDLHVPLLADVHGAVTEAYGVAAEDPGYRTRRAVVVIDPEGTVRYAWAAESLKALPDVDRVRAVVEGVGGGRMSLARYRVGHAHYVEGRRAFSSATAGFEDREWLLAKQDFTQADGEFAEATDTFDTAARFADSDDHRAYYERARRKAEELSRAAEWLAKSAGGFASGEGREGEQLRADAETPLEAARDIPDPVQPDEFPPDDLPAADGTAGREPAGDPATLAGGTGGEAGPAAEGEPGGQEPGSEPTAGSIPESDGPTGGTDAAAAGGFTRNSGGDGDEGGEGTDGSDEPDGEERDADGSGIDDAELAAIAADIEGQDREGAGDADRPEPEGPGDGESAGGAEAVEGEVELDLADPSEEESDAGAGSQAGAAADDGPADEHGDGNGGGGSP